MIPQRYKDLGFTKVNTPKRTPNHKTKSHAVLVKDGESYKLIRFGQQGVSGSPKKEGESKAYANRRKSFKSRHAKNIAKGKTSAAYWADRVKWRLGGQVEDKSVLELLELINTTGYTPGTDTYNNPINIIPSGEITMENTPFDILAIPNNDKPKIMKSGKKYNFKNSDNVLEIPMLQDGGFGMLDKPIFTELRNRELNNIKKVSANIDKHIKNLPEKDKGKVKSTIFESLFDYDLSFDDLKKSLGKKVLSKIDQDALEKEILSLKVANNFISKELIPSYEKSPIRSTMNGKRVLLDEAGNVLQTYQIGGGIDFTKLLSGFNSIGVDTTGVSVDDPKQSVANLMLALAASQMYLKGDNNVDLSSPMFMQYGGLMNPNSLIPKKLDDNTARILNQQILQYNSLLAPGQQELNSYKTGFWSKLNPFSKSNRERLLENVSNIRRNNTNFQQIQQQTLDQESKSDFTDSFKDLPFLLGMFSSLANLEKGGEVMHKDIQTDGTFIPIQAERRSGQDEMIFDGKMLSPVKATKEHSEYKDNQVTDLPNVPSYIFSADDTTKFNFKDILVGIDDGGYYKDSKKTKEPKSKYLSDYIGNKKGTPAYAAEAVGKKIPVKEDKRQVNRDPYLENSNTENRELRNYLVSLIAQKAEEDKMTKNKGKSLDDEVIKAQLGSLLYYASRLVPPLPELPTIGEGVKPLFSALKNKRPIPYPQETVSDDEYLNFLDAAQGASSLLGSIMSWRNNNKALKDLTKYTEKSKRSTADMADKTREATTKGMLATILGNLALKTNVDVAEVDDSYYRNLNPSFRSYLKNLENRNSYNAMLSNIRNSNNLSTDDKQRLVASASNEMYKSNSADTYFNYLDLKEKGLQDARNTRFERSANASNTERGLENEKLAAIAYEGAKSPLAMNTIDLKEIQDLLNLDANSIAQSYGIKQKRAQDIGGAFSGATSILSKLFG